MARVGGQKLSATVVDHVEGLHGGDLFGEPLLETLVRDRVVVEAQAAGEHFGSVD